MFPIVKLAGLVLPFFDLCTMQFEFVRATHLWSNILCTSFGKNKLLIQAAQHTLERTILTDTTAGNINIILLIFAGIPLKKMLSTYLLLVLLAQCSSTNIVQRMNYGVLFESIGIMTNAEQSWHHTIHIPLLYTS